MALRGKKPSDVPRRLKMLAYGKAGVGKTMAAIQFPKPYLIDTEKGAVHKKYTAALERAGGVSYQTSDHDEIRAELLSLISEQHNYQTVVIDSVTKLYSSMLDVAEEMVGTEYGRHYGQANVWMKSLLRLLLRLDMNVVVTAHSKTEYGDDRTSIGETFDGYKKLDYEFDLVIEVGKRGQDRVGRVAKTRLDEFPDSEVFDWSYDAIAAKYGRDDLERNAAAVEIASPDQVDKVHELIKLTDTPPETVAKWLKAAGCGVFDEMPEDKIVKTIAHLDGARKDAKK